VLNRYRSGQVGYTEVITAQATALSARRALVQAQADRQTTAVALIQSLGGGWRQAHAGQKRLVREAQPDPRHRHPGRRHGQRDADLRAGAHRLDRPVPGR
jgi:hypothetical protein